MLTSMEKYLFVTVNYATEVPGDALPNCFMLVKYGDDIARTRIAHNHSNPRWGQAFAFGLAEKNQPIGFRLMDKDYEFTAFKIDLGNEMDAAPKLYEYKFAEYSIVSIKIQVCSFFEGPGVEPGEVNPKELPVWEVDLDKLNSAQEIVLKKEVVVVPPAPTINLNWAAARMNVKVIGILGMLTSGTRDCYIKIKYRDRRKKTTRHFGDSYTPVWNEEFTFKFDPEFRTIELRFYNSMYGGQHCESTKKVEIELVEQKEYEVVFFDSRTPAWLTFTIKLFEDPDRCTDSLGESCDSIEVRDDAATTKKAKKHNHTGTGRCKYCACACSKEHKCSNCPRCNGCQDCGCACACDCDSSGSDDDSGCDCDCNCDCNCNCSAPKCSGCGGGCGGCGSDDDCCVIA